MPVRVVFFDLVGTLIRARSSIGAQYAAIARRFGIQADARALDRAFGTVLAEAATYALPDPAESDMTAREKRAWRAIVETVFAKAGFSDALGLASFDEYFEALFNHFATRDAWVVYPDVVPSLEELRIAGLRIGLISNFDSRIFPLLDRLGLAAAFTTVTIPAVACAAKPDPLIFRHALAAEGIPADEALYVGDSVAEDIVPARAAGLAAVLVDRGRGHAHADGMTRIESLNALGRLVAGTTLAAARTPRRNARRTAPRPPRAAPAGRAGGRARSRHGPRSRTGR
jgi:putative hydrolase of the HAD superfamily